jgi:hypothetical protein
MSCKEGMPASRQGARHWCRRLGFKEWRQGLADCRVRVMQNLPAMDCTDNHDGAPLLPGIRDDPERLCRESAWHGIAVHPAIFGGRASDEAAASLEQTLRRSRYREAVTKGGHGLRKHGGYGGPKTLGHTCSRHGNQKEVFVGSGDTLRPGCAPR